MFNQSLIQYILQKLKTGDSRSININAIPGKLATRFDIADFSDIDQNLLKDFFDKLFNNSSFKFKLDLGSIEVEDGNKERDDNKLFQKLTSDKISKKKWGILLKRLNTIIASEEDEFQEHGVKSFGFGYPLLIKKTPRDFGEDKIIVAPVFIWKLTIERLKSSKYTYQISRDEEMGLGLNEVLLGNLETNDKIIIKQLGEDIIDDGILKPQELLENLNSLLSKCGSSQVYSELQEIQKIPSSKKELGEFYGSQGLEKPAIFWGGVFGLYRTLKEKIIEDTKKLPIEDNLIDNEDIDQLFDFEHPYGSVNTDPSQQTILNKLKEKEGMVIQGPPGTGKSQTITAIITNALDNNKKCLVVCEKKTALEVIKNNLSKIGLGDMCALIEDVNTARKDIVELVRNKQEHGFGYFGFKGNEYKSILKEVDSLIEKNTFQKELLRKDYFNNINRKSLVGNYLKKSREANNEIIDKIHEEIAEHIKDHSYENYDMILKIIKEAEELNFPGVNTIFLNKLKTSIFIENGSYITCKNQFEKFIKQLSENRESLETRIKEFESIIENSKNNYDTIFNNNYNIKNKFINNGENGEYINILMN